MAVRKINRGDAGHGFQRWKNTSTSIFLSHFKITIVLIITLSTGVAAFFAYVGIQAEQIGHQFHEC
jgi:hypothetical protein